MTREEQIIEYANSFKGKGVESDELKEIIRLAIIDGAKWADAHPQGPSLPSNLDEAAEETAKKYYCSCLEKHNETGICDGCENVKLSFKAGAEWMAEQGETFVSMIDCDDNGFYLDSFEQQNEVLRKLNIKVMDRAIVQIRKK